jgi:Flp pilus assembly protein TadD
MAVVLILMFSFLTFQRAQVFASEESLFRDTLKKNPAAWGIHIDLGVILASRQNYSEAIEHFLAALRYDPGNPDAESYLGQALSVEGKFGEAEPHFLEAIKSAPNEPDTHKRYAMALMSQGRTREALSQLRIALALSSKPEIRTRLDYATLLHQAGDVREAVAQLRKVLSLQPDSVEALNNLAWLLATAPDASLRNGAEAVRYAERASRLPAPKQICVPGTLAAAYAEAGRFSEAVATAEAAVNSETAAGEARFAAINQQLLRLYRAGQAFHESPPPGENQ